MCLYFHARMFTYRFVVVKLRDEKLMLGRADVAKQPILEVKNRSIKFECSSFVKTKDAVGNPSKLASALC